MAHQHYLGYLVIDVFDWMINRMWNVSFICFLVNSFDGKFQKHHLFYVIVFNLTSSMKHALTKFENLYSPNHRPI